VPFYYGSRITFGFGAAWVIGHNVVQRIDASSQRVTATAPVPGARFIATGAGSVWVTARKRLVELDPISGREVTSKDLPNWVGSVVVAGRDIWVAHDIGGPDSYEGGVWEIDPSSLKITRSLRVGDVVQMVVAESSIWLHGPNLEWLERIDPATDHITRTRVFVDRGSVVPGNGFLWITDQGSGSVRQVELPTGHVVRTWSLRRAESPASGPAFWCLPARRTVSCFSNGMGRTYAWSIDVATGALRRVQAPSALPSAFGFGLSWSLRGRSIVTTSI
jgi:hypothetical protein